MVRRTAFFKKSDPKTKTFLKSLQHGYSQAVSHPRTCLALQGLTAVIGREPVLFL